jgi:ribosome biogenesis GTPase A
VLWPKLADQQGAYRLAASGAIRDTAFRYMDVALFAARFLRERYPEALAARFKLETIPEEDDALIEALGRRRGFLRRGGVVDLDRAAEVLLRELRAGKIGRISFETPDDFELDEVAPGAEARDEAKGDVKSGVKGGVKGGAAAQ